MFRMKLENKSAVTLTPQRRDGMKRNGWFKVLGIIAVIAMAGLSMSACDNPTNGNNGSSGSGTEGGSTGGGAGGGGTGAGTGTGGAGTGTGGGGTGAGTGTGTGTGGTGTGTGTGTGGGGAGAGTGTGGGGAGTGTQSDITWTVSANSGAPTPSLLLTFQGGTPTGLTAQDITINPGTGANAGSAQRGNLTGSGNTRTLAISNVSAGIVSISINRAGIASTPRTVSLTGAPLQIINAITVTGIPSSVHGNQFSAQITLVPAGGGTNSTSNVVPAVSASTRFLVGGIFGPLAGRYVVELRIAQMGAGNPTLVYRTQERQINQGDSSIAWGQFTLVQ